MLKPISILCFFLIVGCASKIVVQSPPDVKDPDKAWERILQRFVDGKGLVDFAGLQRDRKDLEAYVAYVGRVSPTSRPELFGTHNARLAYYLNSYNALSMFNVLHFEIPKNNGSFFKRFKFFYLTKYLVGGQYQSLYAYENEIIRPLGDPRVHVALNCMALSCPRLPQKPFREHQLEVQLEDQAKEFYNELRNVQVDNKTKTVRLSEILKFFTDDFLKASPSLIAYVNRYRLEKIPQDYAVEFIDYDWTINNQSPQTPNLAYK